MRLDAKTFSLIAILIAYYHPSLKGAFRTLMKGETPTTLPDDAELREAVETAQQVLDGQRALYLGSVIRRGEEALTKTQQRRLRHIKEKTYRINAQAEYRFVWEIQNRLQKWGSQNSVTSASNPNA